MADLYEFYIGNALNIPTYIDNEDVVSGSQELKTSQRNRHMGIRMNCLCEVFDAERFHPLKIASELNPADGLTKLLSGSKFSVSYEQMMDDPIVETSTQYVHGHDIVSSIIQDNATRLSERLQAERISESQYKLYQWIRKRKSIYRVRIRVC